MQKLYERLYEIYERLPEKQRASVFTCMVGDDYFKRDIRLMLVGRAVNGWDDKYDFSSAVSFAGCAKEYFENHKRWRWVMKYDDGKYFSRSRFWAYTEEIFKRLTDFNYEDSRIWMENIAWTNLYKISPKEGNPGVRSLRLQWEGVCPDILDREIEVLKPTHIIFETDYDWLFANIQEKCEKFEGEYVRAKGSYNGADIAVMKRPEQAKKEVYVTDCLRAFGKINA